MGEKDVILAVLGNHIAIAGLILIFAGFLLSKAESYEGSRRGDKYNWLAVAGLIPIIAALLSAEICIEALKGWKWGADHALGTLQIVLALTGVYAIISAVLAFFP